ncbi:MAG: hypothetical protein HZB31_01540 [Nitrospirae bacterium]|nr:hypothetical protein [Nitrospirota bacterium]
MKYSDLITAVDTVKALSLLGIEGEPSGAYVKYPCHKCDKQAVIKSFGEKKNVLYCPECKISGQIVTLTMEVKKLSWEEASKLLEEKAITTATSKITNELTLNYELDYLKQLEGVISPEIAKELGVGKPKGKTMMSGCIAFTVHNESGKKIAYWGMKLKDSKPAFHHSFNPEFYLYNYHRVDPSQEVYFTTDMLQCLKLIGEGKQAICNFGLRYISQEQMRLLSDLKLVNLMTNGNEAITQVIKNVHNVFFRTLRTV